MFSRKLTRSIVVGAAAITVAGGSYGIVTATSSSNPAAASSGSAGSPGSGSNARSGPASGGAAGTVGSVSTSSNGDYNVHYIGVNWPHHVFLNQGFNVIGAE